MNRMFWSSRASNGTSAHRDSVDAYFDKLDSLWTQAEDELAAMQLSVSVQIEINTEDRVSGSTRQLFWRDATYLGWQKIKMDWRICVGTRTDYLNTNWPTLEWKPIAECPREQRIELAEHYRVLKAKAKEVRDKFISHAEAAIASIEQALGK